MEPIRLNLYRQYDLIHDKMLYSLVGTDKKGVEHRQQFSNRCSVEKLGTKVKELIKHLEE
jgi:hypothetical protein